MSDARLAREFVGFADSKLRDHLRQVLRCGRLLSERELWHRANEHCNSVGNLILHLTGNVRQWLVAGVGGVEVRRDRPAEFAQRGPLPHVDILAELEEVVERGLRRMECLPPDTLLEQVEIQGYTVSRLTAIFHVVEHFSGHAGQIVHMTKVLRDVDLSLYDERGRRLGSFMKGP